MRSRGSCSRQRVLEFITCHHQIRYRIYSSTLSLASPRPMVSAPPCCFLKAISARRLSCNSVESKGIELIRQQPFWVCFESMDQQGARLCLRSYCLRSQRLERDCLGCGAYNQMMNIGPNVARYSKAFDCALRFCTQFTDCGSRTVPTQIGRTTWHKTTASGYVKVVMLRMVRRRTSAARREHWL